MEVETEQTYPYLMDDLYYSESSPQVSFATRLQLFAVIIYLLSQAFTIPLFAFGPSWAVWPTLDDFATLFLLLVYIFTQKNTLPMDRTERFIFMLLIIGIILSLPTIFLGKMMHPEAVKGPRFGIFQTYRTIEYFIVWICIRGMIFSSKQFNTISYTVFFIVIFVVIIAIGNISGALPPARLASHLPPQGPTWLMRKLTGATKPLGPWGASSGQMVNRFTLLTAVLLASKKPRALFRLSLVGVVACMVFLSGSRAATIGWCVALAVWSHKSAKQLVVMLTVILLFFMSLYILSDVVESTVFERAFYRVGTIIHRGEDPTMSGRVVHWMIALKYIASNMHILLTGVGWGFGGMVLPSKVGNAHNMYLHTLIELGMFGLIMYLFLVSRIYRWMRGKDRILVGLRAAFTGLLVASLTGEVFYPIASGAGFLGFTAALFAIGVGTHRGKLLEEQQKQYDEEYEFEEGDELYSYQTYY